MISTGLVSSWGEEGCPGLCCSPACSCPGFAAKPLPGGDSSAARGSPGGEREWMCLGCAEGVSCLAQCILFNNSAELAVTLHPLPAGQPKAGLPHPKHTQKKNLKKNLNPPCKQ